MDGSTGPARPGATAARLALACHGLAALMLLAVGVAYLVRSEFMPCHRDAIGLEWRDLHERVQALLLAMMRGTGGGSLASGLAMLLLLAFPFRRGEGWARWAVSAVGAVAWAGALWGALLLKIRTPASPPLLAAAAVGLGLVVLGLALSLVAGRAGRGAAPPPPG